MLTKVEDLKAGQTFIYLRQYFITDSWGAFVQMTGQKSGRFLETGYCANLSQIKPTKKVRVVDLEVAEIY